MGFFCTFESLSIFLQNAAKSLIENIRHEVCNSIGRKEVKLLKLMSGPNTNISLNMIQKLFSGHGTLYRHC